MTAISTANMSPPTWECSTRGRALQGRCKELAPRPWSCTSGGSSDFWAALARHGRKSRIAATAVSRLAQWRPSGTPVTVAAGPVIGQLGEMTATNVSTGETRCRRPPPPATPEHVAREQLGQEQLSADRLQAERRVLVRGPIDVRSSAVAFMTLERLDAAGPGQRVRVDVDSIRRRPGPGRADRHQAAAGPAVAGVDARGRGRRTGRPCCWWPPARPGTARPTRRRCGSCGGWTWTGRSTPRPASPTATRTRRRRPSPPRLAGWSTRPAADWLADMRAGRAFTSAEAVAWGLVDRVGRSEPVGELKTSGPGRPGTPARSRTFRRARTASPPPRRPSAPRGAAEAVPPVAPDPGRGGRGVRPRHGRRRHRRPGRRACWSASRPRA